MITTAGGLGNPLKIGRMPDVAIDDRDSMIAKGG